MHRFPDQRANSEREEADAGFTLIEVLVAFLIIAIIAGAATSVTISGLRATMEAKQLTQAKNLVSERVEAMRGLPYYVAYNSVPASWSDKRVDVLDTYYPSATPATGSPTCNGSAATWTTPANISAWSGYVPASGTGSTARCPFEPQTGAFYRTIWNPAVSGSSPTAIVVASQFIDLAPGTANSAASPRAPAANYVWSNASLDSPATLQMAAHVTAVFGPAGNVHTTTTRTDIADRKAGPTLVTAETNATALIVEGITADGQPVRLELGSVTGNGDVTFLTEATVSAVGGSLQTDVDRVEGAAQHATAPGTGTPSGSATGGVQVLTGTPLAAPSFGMTLGLTGTSGVGAAATGAAPGYGASVASAKAGSFTLDGTPIVTVDPVNSTAGWLVPGSCPSPGAAYGNAGFGWMATGTNSVAACSGSEAGNDVSGVGVVTVFGTIEIQVLDLTARCEVSPTSRTAATSATLKVRKKGDPDWTTLTLSKNADTIGTGVTVTGPPLPDDPTLWESRINAWSAFGDVHATTPTPTATDGRNATAQVPAALTLITNPLRKLADGSDDPNSTVKITVGRASCSATDRR